MDEHDATADRIIATRQAHKDLIAAATVDNSRHEIAVHLGRIETTPPTKPVVLDVTESSEKTRAFLLHKFKPVVVLEDGRTFYRIE